MIERTRNPRSTAVRVAMVTLMASVVTACADSVVANGAQARLAPAPGQQLTPLQQQLLMRPVSAEAIAGRPATRADLEAVRGWFGPGELEAVLAVANRSARARGADTLPHCIPLCGTDSPALEHTSR
ncbi:MAG TPA: hypothetical protein VFT45_15165 [Longimicrobium sp.]|nr:hypothetical protein [Longimicrobium sp.]